MISALSLLLGAERRRIETPVVLALARAKPA